METKNNTKRVEKSFTYHIVDIELTVDQNCPERGVSARLLSVYRLAYIDDDSLNRFITTIKQDTIKNYRRNLDFDVPVISRVVINPVSTDNYATEKILYYKGYLILSEYFNLCVHDLCRHNRNLIQYQPNINSL